MLKILTDQAADLLPEEIERLGITVAPLYIQFPEEEINAGDITPDDFYDRLERMVPEIPTTAMPAPGEFSTLFKEQAKNGDELCSIHISSGLSGTLEAARSGAELSGLDIHLVDTRTLSGGQRFQVLAAAYAAKAGWSMDKISEKLDQIRAATELIYTLETLEYLERGGRIGRVQALAGSLLGLKPVIKVEKADGKYSSAGSARTIKRSLQKIVDYLQDQFGSEDPLWISVMHGRFAEKAEELAESVKEQLNVGKLEILRISPVLGVHTGPGIVGIAAIPLKLMQGFGV